MFSYSFVYYESIAKDACYVNVFVPLGTPGLNINTFDASWIGQETTQLSGNWDNKSERREQAHAGLKTRYIDQID